MKKLEMAKATAPLAEYARKVSTEPVILTVRGKPIAALVSLKNADLETITLSAHPHFLALIERSRARQKTEGGISSAEMRRRLGASKTPRGR
ncbi:MAG: type II toxin-antitoxin system prevent-host-death family antitoxin [Chloroflexi bacterium]|nr:type II toxin-antitoxin system prevent-host-death family antitoxin [Chloroflexota bacterium]